MKEIILLLAFVTITTITFSQKENPTMAERVFKPDYIFEGRPLSGGYCFTSNDKTAILTLNYVIITKEFKGTFTSDTAKIITIGGSVGGKGEVPTEGPRYMGNSDGLFFCIAVPKGEAIPINTDNAFFIYDYISYNNAWKFMPHPRDTVYPNVKEYLYDSLEMVLGKKYVRVNATTLELKYLEKMGKK